MLKGKRAITDFSPQRYGKKSSPKLLDTVDERFSELRSGWAGRERQRGRCLLPGSLPGITLRSLVLEFQDMKVAVPAGQVKEGRRAVPAKGGEPCWVSREEQCCAGSWCGWCSGSCGVRLSQPQPCAAEAKSVILAFWRWLHLLGRGNG